MGIKSRSPERAVLVGVSDTRSPPWLASEHLNELQRLAETAQALVVGRLQQRVSAYNPATLIGEGKVEELIQMTKSAEADLVIFDEDLTGSQVRNLEERLPGIKVLDRTGIILDIFSRHARTAESRIMVEIAQLEYTLPRLTRAWTHLCRQVGGIGTRGPGETQLEVDRRAIRNRIRDLKRKLKKIERARAMQAARRENVFHAAVVGYTNAGKSTLINRLTNAGVLVEDKLFATLDATTRRLYLAPEMPMIISDTVGFIRKLPHHLITTFRSTLGIVSQADCVLEILDCLAPDYKEHMQVTQQALESLVLPEIPRIRVFNKADAVPEETLNDIRIGWPEALLISARENIGIEALKNALMRARTLWERNRGASDHPDQEKGILCPCPLLTEIPACSE